MPIPTHDELSVLVRDVVRSHLGPGALKFEYRLWPQKPRIFRTMFEQDFGSQNDGVLPFGKISIHRPTEDTEWGEVSFTISTRNVTSFNLHTLRLHKVNWILQDIRTSMRAFRNS